MARRPKYAPKPDSNQGEIVKDLHESMPCLIDDESSTASEYDISVWAYDVRLDMWRWTKWEIKTESGKLTAKQKKRMEDWPGSVLLARSADDVLREYGRL